VASASEQVSATAAPASAIQERAQLAEQRAGTLERQIRQLEAQKDERARQATTHRERSRALKHAILAAYEQGRPCSPGPLSTAGIAPKPATPGDQLDALAELGRRINPED
jgi:hypothetical protein